MFFITPSHLQIFPYARLAVWTLFPNKRLPRYHAFITFGLHSCDIFDIESPLQSMLTDVEAVIRRLKTTLFFRVHDHGVPAGSQMHHFHGTEANSDDH
jgi:hypothetical protein